MPNVIFKNKGYLGEQLRRTGSAIFNDVTTIKMAEQLGRTRGEGSQ